MTIYGQQPFSLEEHHCCVKKKKKKKEKDKLHDQARPNQTSYGYEMESNRAIVPTGKSAKLLRHKRARNRTGGEKYFSMLKRRLDFRRWRVPASSMFGTNGVPRTPLLNALSFQKKLPEKTLRLQQG